MYVTFNDVVQPANFANYINRNIELATVTSGNNTHVSYNSTDIDSVIGIVLYEMNFLRYTSILIHIISRIQ